MNNYTSLENQIVRLFEEGLNIIPASNDTNLFETGELDSLLLVDLICAVESTFQIEIPLEELDLDDFRSVECIARLVASRLNKIGQLAISK